MPTRSGANLHLDITATDPPPARPAGRGVLHSQWRNTLSPDVLRAVDRRADGERDQLGRLAWCQQRPQAVDALE